MSGSSDTTTHESPQIFALMGEAMRQIQPIGKDGTNEAQRYNFRSADAVFAAAQPILAGLGIFVAPRVVERVTSGRAAGMPDKQTFADLLVEVRFYAPDGSHVAAIVNGFGADSLDKAANKAHTAAIKLAVCEVFLIPTPEAIDSEAGRQAGATEKILQDAKNQLLDEVAHILESARSGMGVRAWATKVSRAVLHKDKPETIADVDRLFAAVRSGDFDTMTGDYIPPGDVIDAPMLRDNPGQGSLL